MPVSLYTSALASMAHDAVFQPWLVRAAVLAPKAPKSVAVLVPHRFDAYYLKSLALDRGLGLWGVHFLTPSDLRDWLVDHLQLPVCIPERKHLRLLLATAAERVAASNEGGATKSVAAAPEQLLKAIDMIGGAGWSFDQAGPERLRPLVAEFRQLLAGADWQLMDEADRGVQRASRTAAPCFTELFVVGFNAFHWPQWPLLEAAVRLSANSTVCLTEPRTEGEELDTAWIGTWENTFEPAEPIATDRIAPLAEVLRPPESNAARAQLAATPVREIEFLVGADTASHARAIVARAMQYLADPDCERLGILFSGPGALARRVAVLLTELQVPHEDGLAHRAPGPLEDAAWPAWLELQESPRIPTLLRFLAADIGTDFGPMKIEQATFELRRVAQELLIDDLGVVAEYLRGRSREASALLAEALDTLPLLPPNATLGQYFKESRKIFRHFRWKQREEALQEQAAGWQRHLDLRISARTWLRWMQEVLESWRSRRSDTSSHPYSRLHLLPYLEAESQAWTHLIATGLNEGQWPPTIDESGFLDEDEIASLNGEVRSLNRRVAVQGRQGEGHVAVQSGKTLCLGPAQRRALLQRQFNNTLESVTTGITATMQTHEESAPERVLNPSEFFTGLHSAARGRAVSQETVANLQAETARWLDPSRLWPPPVANPAAARSTRAAFDARREPDRAFGEFEFALRAAPSWPLRLNATDWEKALGAPAQTFLAVLLGVSPARADEETPWALAQGSWVHRWLSVLVEAAHPPVLVPLPAATELRERVRTAADRFRGSLVAALVTTRRPLPDWWQSSWQEATTIAGRLAEAVASIPGRTHAATEWNIPNTPLPVDGGDLYVRGRIDLLLGASASPEDLWLVDYKTGRRKPLTPVDLDAGESLQLALYALALRATGSQQVGLSLLAPGGTLDQPQIELAHLDALAPLWRSMLRMQETGVFGMLGALRDEFGHGQDYPLATLAIDEEILDRKWMLTHPDLAPAEDEA